MSLNSFGHGLRNGWAGKIIFTIVTAGMLVTAFTGLGAFLTGRDRDVSAAHTPEQPIATVNGAPISRQVFDNVYQQADQRASQYQPVSILMKGQIGRRRFRNWLTIF